MVGRGRSYMRDKTMTILSGSPIEMARKAHGRILQSMQEPGSQLALAKALGVSQSKNEALKDALALIYLNGFKVVDEDAVTIRSEVLQFLRQRMSRVLVDDEMAKILSVGEV